jgi:dipeptidyl aminopeptidase/acylaminoacyl peptidase
VDAEKGTRLPAFDHAQLAAALTKALEQPVDARRLPLERLAWAETDAGWRFTASGKHWRVTPAGDRVEPAELGSSPAGSLPHLESAHPTEHTGDETWITLVNQTDAAVEVFWLDPENQRKHYATIPPGGRHRQHTFAGHVWLVTDTGGKPLAAFEARQHEGEALIDARSRLKPGAEPKPKRAASPSTSPDGKWQARIRDFNVRVRNLENGEEFALSSDGNADEAYSDRWHWSPDSRKLVVLRVRQGEDRKVTLLESSPRDQLQPKLHTLAYAKPGDRIDVAKPQLFDLVAERQVPVSDTLFSNAWSISEVRWLPDASRFTFLYNQRGHQVLRVISVDARSGEAHAIVDEQSRTFVDYADKLFLHFLDSTSELLWMSERDGWNHLHLYDAQTGHVKNQVTKGEWSVREVERVDEQNRQVWFRAGGIRPGQDPYYVHLARVNFDGSALTVLTEADGTHETEFSPDRRFFLDRWSRVDHPPVTELRRASDGTRVCELERADWNALLATGWRAPERFTAKARDGQTDIYGIIIRPGQFDPARRYPVIEEIYAGPQGAFVPKAFGLQTRPHALAELGFVLVQIDGLGTSYRSKAFHDVCWKNLGDAGFPDRILWLKAAAAKYPWLDLNRVGIYGGSAGGQSALRALLAHGDFYKVAVADCGCHDNRLDKIWWNELWMGWPLGPHYEEQSNVTQAHRLQGKLLLTAGELDRNVDPASTMQVVNALIKADKDFDLLIVPGAGHGVGETPYATRRRMDFFVRHLLGVEPRTEPPS